MNLFVPDIGTQLRIEQDWQITLYAEYRNRSLFDKLELPYKSTVIELPQGLVVKVDRIYIKKGLSQYSSITFACPKPKTKKEKELNPQNEKYGGVKFWVKLHECNGIMMSNVVINDETVNDINELYKRIESEVSKDDLRLVTDLLGRFNSYLGPGLNLNNLQTNLTTEHFINNMLNRIDNKTKKSDIDKLIESEIKIYLRDFKIRKILG